MLSSKIFTTRWLKPLLFGAIAVLVSLAVATAQDRERDRPRYKDDPNARAGVQPQAGPAVAPNARLAALIRAPDGVIVKSTGVQNVQRIARGVYCIRPTAASGVDPQTAIVIVSVEYFYSLINEVTVQWARQQNGCGASRIGVYTLADENLNAVYNFSNTVGFAVYVP
jgi:hypothetical protein